MAFQNKKSERKKGRPQKYKHPQAKIIKDGVIGAFNRIKPYIPSTAKFKASGFSISLLHLP